jgi:hypothetical protein
MTRNKDVMTNAAVFSCLGLGDGLIALVLSHNLSQNGYEVTTFHPSLSGLQRWFPHLPIRSFPAVGELALYDRFFIVYEKSPQMEAILKHCEEHYPDKTCVLNPIATKKTDYPYWSHGRFDGSISFVDNLVHFCKETLRLESVTKSNGIIPPAGVQPFKEPKRVIIHPTSTKESKNWPREKYLALAEELRALGYFPSFTVSSKERGDWQGVELSSLDSLARHVCESGYMVGNDSGVGHLASCLGLPTVTVCPRKAQAQFWRPAWQRGEVILPAGWIPNFKGFRLRDQHWKRWIGVSKVVKAFLRLS